MLYCALYFTLSRIISDYLRHSLQLGYTPCLPNEYAWNSSSLFTFMHLLQAFHFTFFSGDRHTLHIVCNPSGALAFLWKNEWSLFFLHLVQVFKTNLLMFLHSLQFECNPSIDLESALKQSSSLPLLHLVHTFMLTNIRIYSNETIGIRKYLLTQCCSMLTYVDKMLA